MTSYPRSIVTLALACHAAAVARQQQKYTFFYTTRMRVPVENCCAVGDTLQISATSSHCFVLQFDENHMVIQLLLLILCHNVTDRHTDRQTVRVTAITIMSRSDM